MSGKFDFYLSIAHGKGLCALVKRCNNRIIKPEDFDFRESGAVFLSDTGRKSFLQKWQERKREPITHPFLEEKLPWGLVPYVQSLLLARYLRGDLDDYPPFLWK